MRRVSGRYAREDFFLERADQYRINSIVRAYFWWRESASLPSYVEWALRCDFRFARDCGLRLKQLMRGAQFRRLLYEMYFIRFVFDPRAISRFTTRRASRLETQGRRITVLPFAVGRSHGNRRNRASIFTKACEKAGDQTVRRSFMNLLDWDFLTRASRRRSARRGSGASFSWLSRTSRTKNRNNLFI